jgi:cation diffusion facilitator family transporter
VSDPALKNSTRYSRADRSPAVRRTLWIILWVNVIAVIIKVIVGVRTQALSVLGAALESGLDTLNNIIGMVLVSVAAREPDEDHPYGHDKFETLGALAVVGFLSISCFELLRQGISDLISRQAPEVPSTLEVLLIAMSGVLNVFVVWYERRRGRELHSVFLLADAHHTASDIYITALALIALILGKLGLGALDPALAIIVALVIAWNGYEILRDTIPVLVDSQGVSPDRIREALTDLPEIEEIRAIRSRYTASGMLFAEITIGVAADSSVADAHRISDMVEQRIAERLGASEVLVHVEPID